MQTDASAQSTASWRRKSSRESAASSPQQCDPRVVAHSGAEAHLSRYPRDNASRNSWYARCMKRARMRPLLLALLCVLAGCDPDETTEIPPADDWQLAQSDLPGALLS